MKRILMSASAIVFVAALAYGATGAFFSDTETSSGNTFTAGSIDLTVDSTSHYNGNICTNTGTVEVPVYTWQGNALYPAAGTPCNGTWTATNLGASNQFFSFADVKPGDSGEDTVSLHIDSNPAWACLDIGTNANNENGANEPELSAGDTTANGPADGELAGNISVIGWHDNGAEGDNGNNIWDADETALFPQTTLSGLNATTTLALADSITGTPLDPTITNNIGLAWCAGTFTASGPGVTPVCDGSSMGNITQTDSATSTVSFRVEQFRNNPNFTCGGTPPGTTVVDTNDLFTGTVVDAVTSGKWFFYNDTNDSVMTTDQFSLTGGQNHMDTTVGVQGAKMLLDNGTQAPDYTSNVNWTGNPRYNIATFQFQGTLLSAITALKYRVYDATSDSDKPFLNFNVDFTGSNVFQNRLVYVPTSLPVNTWTTVDAIQGGAALWTYSGANWPSPNPQPGTTPKTWNQILTDYPSAKILGTGGWLGVRVGEPGPIGASATVDSVQFNATTYDFQI